MTTPTGGFRHLFQPIRIGSVTAPNRIVFDAHRTNYGTPDGLPSDRLTAYYQARARGGAGLIITEELSVHPSDRPHERALLGHHPDLVAGLRPIAEAVHRHGVPVLARLGHHGAQAPSLHTRRPLWAPSPVPDPLIREMPKAMDRSEIVELVDAYATTAEHCLAAGFDGIEVSAADRSILRAFLSPVTNHRTDGYGGDPAGRSRLLHEVVAAVRDRIGPDPVLLVGLCGDELLDGGLTIDDAVAVSRALEAAGGVDGFNTSIGTGTSSRFLTEASMHVRPGFALFAPSAIRATVALPVVAGGRFKDPRQADRALTEGHADLIAVVQGLIADPDFGTRARAGDTGGIRRCLSCNQECVGRVARGRGLGCVEHPGAGREAQPAPPRPIPSGAFGPVPSGSLGPASPHGSTGSAGSGAERRADRPPSPRPAFTRRGGGGGTRALVVGAGPAGLQTAVGLAGRGIRVTVLEAADEIGGLVRLAASVPSRAELGDLVRNLAREARRAGVRVETGVRATTDLVEMLAPEAVVVATGSTPARPWWAPPEPAGHVVDVVDVLGGVASPTGSVVVLDGEGFHRATSAAELLADRGCRVEIVTAAPVVGRHLADSLDLETWWYRAAARGITQTTDLAVRAHGDGVLTLVHRATGAEERRRPDWIVVATAGRPADGLYHRLHSADPTASRFLLRRVGDCVAPRRADAAVLDGHRVATELALLLAEPRSAADAPTTRRPARSDPATVEGPPHPAAIGDGPLTADRPDGGSDVTGPGMGAR